MASYSYHCSICAQLPAFKFCCCNEQDTFVCQYCIKNHETMFVGQQHFYLNLEAYGHHRAKGYYGRYQQRTEAIERGKKELEKNLLMVDQCIREVEIKFYACKQLLENARNLATRDLQAKRYELEKEITRSLQIAQSIAHLDELKLSDELVGRLRDESTPKADFVMFWYKINEVALKFAPESLLQMWMGLAQSSACGSYTSTMSTAAHPQCSYQTDFSPSIPQSGNSNGWGYTPPVTTRPASPEIIRRQVEKPRSSMRSSTPVAKSTSTNFNS